MLWISHFRRFVPNGTYIIIYHLCPLHRCSSHKSNNNNNSENRCGANSTDPKDGTTFSMARCTISQTHWQNRQNDNTQTHARYATCGKMKLFLFYALLVCLWRCLMLLSPFPLDSLFSLVAVVQFLNHIIFSHKNSEHRQSQVCLCVRARHNSS